MSNEGKTKMSMGQRLAYSFGAFGNDAFTACCQVI